MYLVFGTKHGTVQGSQLMACVPQVVHTASVCGAQQIGEGAGEE